MTNQCSSYHPDKITCVDGFVQKPFCAGYGECICCGHVSNKATPYCMRDDVPNHMLDDSGAPSFRYSYREAEGDSE